MSGWPVDQMTGEESSTREPSMTSTHRGKLELWIGKDKLYALVKCPLFDVSLGQNSKGPFFSEVHIIIAMG